MFDLQLQLFHASTKAASDLGDAYVTALKDAFEALPTEQAAEPQDSPSEATVSQADAAFELPKVPQPGGSWYRPPYENPVVAFWDELLKPWQAISPAGLQPGFQSANSPNAWFAAQGLMQPFAATSIFSGMPQLQGQTFDPWFGIMGGERSGDSMAALMATVLGLNMMGGNSLPGDWKALVAYQSEAGMAIAKILFPNQTFISMPVAVPQALLSLPAWQLPR